MGLQENFQKETVEKLDLREAIKVSPKSTLRNAIALMRENKIGCVVVVGGDGIPVGFFTESMVVELLSHGSLPLADPIIEHMSQRFPWVRNSDPVADVVGAMELKNTRLLCVLDSDDQVVGITGQRGVMEYVAEHFPGQVMVQRVGQSPFLSDREGA